MAADTRPLDEIFDPRFRKDMTLAERMHLVMTRIDYVQKDKKDAMKYTIVSHDKVTALVREHTVACGVHYAPIVEGHSFRTDGNRAELAVAVRFTSIHDPSDYLDVLGIGYGIDPGDKGPGKAMSYAVKYALLKAFGLETGDDPDEDQDTQHRSNLDQRADQLITRLLNVAGADELIVELTSPATIEIMTALKARNPAEANRLWAIMKQAGAKHNVDPKTATYLGDGA